MGFNFFNKGAYDLIIDVAAKNNANKLIINPKAPKIAINITGIQVVPPVLLIL